MCAHSFQPSKELERAWLLFASNLQMARRRFSNDLRVIQEPLEVSTESIKVEDCTSKSIASHLQVTAQLANADNEGTKSGSIGVAQKDATGLFCSHPTP